MTEHGTAGGRRIADDNDRRQRFLVTGGAGFLGINLVRYLLARGHDVASLDVAAFDYADCRNQVAVYTGDMRSSLSLLHTGGGPRQRHVQHWRL